jgi:hypothetical protein
MVYANKKTAGRSREDKVNEGILVGAVMMGNRGAEWMDQCQFLPYHVTIM